MRFLLYAAFSIFTIFCIIVAVSNGGIINFSLDPLPINISMPSFMLVFLGILIGLGGGWCVSIFNVIKHTRRHRVADKRIKELENELKKQDFKNNKLSNDQNHGKSA